MIAGKEFHGIIHRIFHEDVKGYQESQQLQVNCPRCQQRDGLSSPDGKYNLEINTAKKVFRCWKCDTPKFSGSLGKLVKLYGSYSDYELYKSYGGIDHSLWDDDENEEEVFIEVSLPNEFISFADMDVSNPDHMAAYMYLVVDRKIDKETIFRYRLGFCTTGTYHGRIIIPSFDREGSVNYFVSRAYKKGIGSYLNPKANKNLLIFNEGLINWDSTVYLVEGAFEMFSTVNAVPLLGKTIGNALLFKLKEHRPPVVIVLDPDAYKNGVEIFQKLSAIYVGDEDKIKIVKLKGKKDLDEIRVEQGRIEVLKLLYGATQLNTDDYFRMRTYNSNYGWKNKCYGTSKQSNTW